jgi:hypothetical protein
MTKNIPLFCLLLFCFNAFGTRIIVKQDGSGNYPTIQQAINASSGGDTVLVYPGTYYENLNFNGKGITVASLYLLNSADSLIRQTIIDGNHNGSVVLMISGEDEHTLLCGFTLQHGSGSVLVGIYPEGGGIGIKNAQPKIMNCLIKDNEANFGGGLYCDNSTVCLSGNTFYNNHGNYGGGIMIANNTLIVFDSIKKNNIYLNYAGKGIDVYKTFNCAPIHIIIDTFTVVNPDNYYIASVDEYGFPVNDVTTDILHAKVQTVHASLYVSPSGNNGNSGLSASEPLQTISYALTKMASVKGGPPVAIHLANGTYSPSQTGDFFPLNLKSYVNIVGADRDSTILSADNLHYHLKGNNNVCNFSVKNLTLTHGNAVFDHGVLGSVDVQYCNNISFDNLLITENNCHSDGAAYLVSIANTDQSHLNKIQISANMGSVPLFISNVETLKSFSVDDCIVQHNQPDGDPETWDGGGIGIAGDGLNPPPFIQGTLKNLVVVQNQKDIMVNFLPIASEAIAITAAKVDIVNATIGENTNINPALGGAICMDRGSQLNIYNSIIFGNTPPAFFVYRDIVYDPPCILNISHCLVENGEDGVVDYTGNNTIIWGEGNIDSIPGWDIAGQYPYALTGSSPCIDAGTVTIPGITLPVYDILGNPRVVGGTVDMGAYEYQDINPGIREINPFKKKNQLAVYPNPFRQQAVISLSLALPSQVELIIYDLSGNPVKMLADARLSEGKYDFIWDGTDNHHRNMPSGEYLAVMMKDGKVTERIKLIMIP